MEAANRNILLTLSIISLNDQQLTYLPKIVMHQCNALNWLMIHQGRAQLVFGDTASGEQLNIPFHWDNIVQGAIYNLQFTIFQGAMADEELMLMLDQLFQAITGTGTVIVNIHFIILWC